MALKQDGTRRAVRLASVLLAGLFLLFPLAHVPWGLPSPTPINHPPRPPPPNPFPPFRIGPVFHVVTLAPHATGPSGICTHRARPRFWRSCRRTAGPSGTIWLLRARSSSTSRKGPSPLRSRLRRPEGSCTRRPAASPSSVGSAALR